MNPLAPKKALYQATQASVNPKTSLWNKAFLLGYILTLTLVCIQMVLVVPGQASFHARRAATLQSGGLGLALGHYHESCNNLIQIPGLCHYREASIHCQ